MLKNIFSKKPVESIDEADHEENLTESRLDELSGQLDLIDGIIENIQDGFIMLDSQGTIIKVNQSARSIFGAGEDYKNNNANYLTRDTVFLDKVRAVLQGYSGKMFLEREQIYKVSFIPSAGGGAIILIADVTERQMTQKARREYSANVSNQLRVPLDLISGFAEIISTGNASLEDAIHFGEKIKSEARRMTDLIENITFLSKLEETDGKEPHTHFDVSVVATQAIESMYSIAEANRIDLALAGSPTFIYGNRSLIYAMFINLISNAINFNKPGGEVKIAVSLRNRFAYINVTDTGIGIPKHEQHRVFERFYQKDGGTGLGLPIARHIVRHHCGIIEIESVPNEGTTVFVKLPQG